MNFSIIKTIWIFMIICIPITIQKNDYDLLLEWGLNNSLEISDKIKMIYINENNKTYYCKEKIFENETILDIPNSILLNVENVIKLYGKKAKKLYKKFNSYFNATSNHFIIDQQFLAYIMYNINKKKKKKNNNFYQHFKYLFNTFESNLDSFPIFYNLEQLYLIQYTSLHFLIDYLKLIYKAEIDILEKNLKLKKINKDDYYVFRTYCSSKAVNISGHSVIAPFLDMFNKHPTKYNLRVHANDNSTKVVATRDILPSEILKIKNDKLTNRNSLILFGITFDENDDKLSSYRVPILNPALLYNYNKSKDNLNQNYKDYMDIAKDNFYNKYIEVYKNLSLDLGGDGSQLSAYKLILENLETLKLLNTEINISSIYKVFYQQKDIESILRIIRSDHKYLTERIAFMKKVVDDYEKNNNNKNLNTTDL